MFSRAKREQGARGARIHERVWVPKAAAEAEAKQDKPVEQSKRRRAAGPQRETIKVVRAAGGDEDDDALIELMDEAVERGYGSDYEVSVKKRQ